MEFRTYPLPKGVIPPLSTMLVYSAMVSPGTTLYPCGLSIPERIAKNLLVHDIKVGRNSQLIAPGILPGSLFSDDRPPVLLRFDSMSRDLRFTLNVENRSYDPLPFEAEILCHQKGDRLELLSVMGCCAQATNVNTSSMTISVSPQMLFEPTRLHVAPRVLDSYQVEGLECEMYLDQNQASRVSPEMVSRENLLAGGALKLTPISTVASGQFLSLNVKEVTETTAMFQAALLGHTPASSSLPR